MFVTIETKGASHIAIYVPHTAAEKSLPAIAAMLEQNAVFINKSYNDITLVNPAMGITLGDRLVHDNYEASIVIAEKTAVIGEGFELATPEVFVSNKTAMKRKDDELTKLRTELSYVKSELAATKEKLQAIIGADAEE